jgi:hypothetical protein
MCIAIIANHVLLHQMENREFLIEVLTNTTFIPELQIGSFIALALLLNLTAPPVYALTFSTVIRGGKRILGSEILRSAGAGFFAGCLHTLSGPDHLVALAPLSIGRTRTESALVGALWGFGHDAGQVC